MSCQPSSETFLDIFYLEAVRKNSAAFDYDYEWQSTHYIEVEGISPEEDYSNINSSYYPEPDIAIGTGKEEIL